MTTTEARGRFEAAVKVLEREHLRARKADRFSQLNHYEACTKLDQRSALMTSFESKAAALVEHALLTQVAAEFGEGLGFEVRLSNYNGTHFADMTVWLVGTQLATQQAAA